MWKLTGKVEDRTEPLDESFFDKLLNRSMEKALEKHSEQYPELTSDQKSAYIEAAKKILKKEESKITNAMKRIITNKVSPKFKKAYTIKVDYSDAYCDSKGDGAVNFPILYWELTKAYPNAREQMHEDGCNMFFNEYNNIREDFIDFLDKNYNPRGSVGWSVSEDGDWDEGFIYICIPISQLSINFNETTEETQLTEASKRNKVEVKKKIGKTKINLSKGNVDTEDIVSDIVRKARGKQNDQVYVDPLTGKMSMNVGGYEISWKP